MEVALLPENSSRRRARKNFMLVKLKSENELTAREAGEIKLYTSLEVRLKATESNS